MSIKNTTVDEKNNTNMYWVGLGNVYESTIVLLGKGEQKEKPGTWTGRYAFKMCAKVGT
jgi:hypothetical protein